MSDVYNVQSPKDIRNTAQEIFDETEIASQKMVENDIFNLGLTINIKQKGKMSDAKELRELIARQLSLIAIHLTAN